MLNAGNGIKGKEGSSRELFAVTMCSLCNVVPITTVGQIMWRINGIAADSCYIALQNVSRSNACFGKTFNGSKSQALQRI